MQTFRDPERGGSPEALEHYLSSQVFEDAVLAEYNACKGKEGGKTNSSFRGYRNVFVDTDFCAKTPLAFEYLQLRLKVCQMISRFQCGGQEDELKAFTTMCTNDAAQAVGNSILYSTVVIIAHRLFLLRTCV